MDVWTRSVNSDFFSLLFSDSLYLALFIHDLLWLVMVTFSVALHIGTSFVDLSFRITVLFERWKLELYFILAACFSYPSLNFNFFWCRTYRIVLCSNCFLSRSIVCGVSRRLYVEDRIISCSDCWRKCSYLFPQSWCDDLSHVTTERYEYSMKRSGKRKVVVGRMDWKMVIG